MANRRCVKNSDCPNVGCVRGYCREGTNVGDSCVLYSCFGDDLDCINGVCRKRCYEQSKSCVKFPNTSGAIFYELLNNPWDCLDADYYRWGRLCLKKGTLGKSCNPLGTHSCTDGHICYNNQCTLICSKDIPCPDSSSTCTVVSDNSYFRACVKNSSSVDFSASSSKVQVGTIVGVVLAVIFVILAVFGGYFFWRRRLRRKIVKSSIPDEPPPPYSSLQ